MANVQPKPKKVSLDDARWGEPHQKEAAPAGTPTEAIDRRTIRQAIMTQMLTEIAEEILKSDADIDRLDENGKLVKGNLRERYEKYEQGKDPFPLLRAFIMDPETAFNTRRNKLFVVKDHTNRNITQPFGSINLTVFRSAMALGDGESPVNVEEVAKRVVIRAGRSSYYGPRAGAGYVEPAGAGYVEPTGAGYVEPTGGEKARDRGFAGCK
jgi:hypothetical protein